MTASTTDQRLARGARSRAAIARRAADVASVEGLDGLSIGRLATDLGISKSGIATLFGSKEALQLAACRAAREVFVTTVVEPGMREPRGIGRVRALVGRWLDYIDDPVFPGGCFRAATLAEFDSRPGPVRDALAADNAEWLALLDKQIRHAAEAGELPGRDIETMAFEIAAVVTAANTARQLGDETGVAAARRIIDRLLAGPAD
ncbi:MAG TPA: TetR/AcrR family transcriptional regulator [Nocardia sp.]|uniref:TetR/AcrR family transcriptional regulator n=1 Tax=Nocardia TaxID=1817 RepID=UPI002458F276|nr:MULTISPECIES: TetR/AcrR family transcriptional regulator [Nocardia]HLS75418.1 TetR/AcrR family transcriptional regulator [Nocardia sp.]